MRFIIAVALLSGCSTNHYRVVERCLETDYVKDGCRVFFCFRPDGRAVFHQELPGIAMPKGAMISKVEDRTRGGL